MTAAASALTLALDTSSAACTAALFDADGALIGARDLAIGRGHAEHLMPMIADLMAGRAAAHILVGCGPGSFTGLRVGLAAAHGMAIGWGASLAGFSSLALLAATAMEQAGGQAGAQAGAQGQGAGPVTVAQAGGHGELFVQTFTRTPFADTAPLRNLPPAEAALLTDAPLIVGSGAAALAAAGARGEARDVATSAAFARHLPLALRSLAPRLVYARAPDARPRAVAA